MAVSSVMLPLGTEAPAFALRDVRSGGTVSTDSLDAGPLLVMFICNHCPYVKHIQPGLVALGNDYADADIDIVGISSNDAAQYPDDAPAELARTADALGYRFPVLHDATQDVAKRYHAACTPDFFLFDADRKLVYRGQFDGSRPGSEEPVTGADIRAAIDGVLAGAPAPTEQHPSIGCSIKWKPGNEPE